MAREDAERRTPSGMMARLMAKLRPREASGPPSAADAAAADRSSSNRASGTLRAGQRPWAVAAGGAVGSLRSDASTGGRQNRPSAQPDGEQPARATLRSQTFQSAVDAQIRHAQRRGDFDNLPGKGRPLDLREQPGEAEGTWATHRVLYGAGMELPWLALAKEIDADLAACRRARERLPLATRIRRRELLATVEEHARAARQKTARYNLMVPHMQLQRLGVDAEGMIREAREEVEALETRERTSINPKD